MKVVPPNFGNVEEHIYRCGAPQPRHYGFLASLHLKTCVLLTDTHDESFICWLRECGVTLLCPLSVPTHGEEGRREDDESTAVMVDGTLGAREGQAAEAVTQVMIPGDAGEGGDGLGLPGGSSMSNQIVSRGSGTSGGTGGGDGGAGGEDRESTASPANTELNSNINVNSGGMGGGGGAGGNRPASNVARFLKENTSGRGGHSMYSPITDRQGGFPVAVSSAARMSAQQRMQYYTLKSGPSSGAPHRGLMTLSEPVVVDILHVLLDPRNCPLLITCAKGRYRTGIVCGCLRKLQRWNLVSILEEYRRFAGEKTRADNEEFIELFDKDLVCLELPDGRRPTILYDA